jgi:predicted Ser/Thr protein kinase
VEELALSLSPRDGATSPEDLFRRILGHFDASGDQAELLSASLLDRGRRVYRIGDRAYKIVLARYTTTEAKRALNLAQESALLRELAALSGVPRLVDYQRLSEGEVLVSEYVSGHLWNGLSSHVTKALITFPRLLALLYRLSRRGMVHGDVNPDNVVIDAAGRPWLLDFDQAQRAPVWPSFLANFLGIPRKGLVVHFGALQFLKRWLQGVLPPQVLAPARRVSRRLRGLPPPVVQRLGSLPAGASEKLRLLHQAWQIGAASDASAPGEGVCYYALTVDGFHLPGERPWQERWAMLEQAVDWSGARVLELGCNMGLLGTSAMLRGAEAVMGVDADPLILEANRLVQQANGVRYSVAVCNFDDSKDWEVGLAAFRPTVVTALSVLNWVKDHARFVRFLGRCETVLFEGHEPVEVEISRLAGAGFTRVERLGRSERARGVLIARKR